MNAAPEFQPRAFVPGPDNTRLLRDAFGRFATGVTIVTAASESGPVAITANSFSSVSLDPPLVIWAPDRNSRRFPHFESAEHYAIHVLAADQDALCFATAKNVHALLEHSHHTNAHGVPLIDGCLARFECRRVACHEGGDHLLVLGQVERAVLRDDGDALAFFRGQVRKIDMN
ncbi:flavin reductase family protein [Thioclava sp. 15-R06ZXC-3]|uniref:Flavin reductase family protein n=1 Tax=Thioclava arctica TaxID=3238301 RepID=A0ABV3TNF5_9RHOB